MLLTLFSLVLAVLTTAHAWQLTVYSSKTCSNDRKNEFISLPNENTGCVVYDFQDYYGSPGDFGDGCSVDIYQAGGNQKAGCDNPKDKLFTLTAADKGKCRSYGAAGYYKATCGDTDDCEAPSVSDSTLPVQPSAIQDLRVPAWNGKAADYPNVGLLYRVKGLGRCAVCTAWPYTRSNKNFILTAGHCLQMGWTLKEVDWGKVGRKDKGVGTSQVTSSKCTAFSGDVLLCPVKSLPSGVTPFTLVPTSDAPSGTVTTAGYPLDPADLASIPGNHKGDIKKPFKTTCNTRLFQPPAGPAYLELQSKAGKGQSGSPVFQTRNAARAILVKELGKGYATMFTQKLIDEIHEVADRS